MHRLLLVEDEEHLRTYMRMHVRWAELGIEQVADADSAESALRAAQSHPPDILLTDIRLPGQSGIALARQLRARFPGMQVIFMSAYSDTEYLHAALRIGSVDYLFKPVQLDELQNAVIRAVAMLERMQKEKGSARLIEHYSEQLMRPLLTHLLLADQPLEDLLQSMDTLSAGRKGLYRAVRLPSEAEISDLDSLLHSLKAPSACALRLLPLSARLQVLLCRFDTDEDEALFRQVLTWLQANGCAASAIQPSRAVHDLSGWTTTPARTWSATCSTFPGRLKRSCRKRATKAFSAPRIRR